jgi:hypothetical protein
MPFSVYQNVIVLVVPLSVRRGPGAFMNVMMKEHGTFDNEVLDVAKFTTLTAL